VRRSLFSWGRGLDQYDQATLEDLDGTIEEGWPTPSQSVAGPKDMAAEENRPIPADFGRNLQFRAVE
jgi:hypothetical protein